MWLLTHDGMRVASSARHPELLTVPAPRHLQDACLRLGGRTWQGKQRFRLVLASSRYMIAGGHEFVFLDEQGNYQKTCPAEMLMPRYQLSREEWGLYLLEEWHPAEWFYEHGFGLASDVEWSASGKAIRSMEPVWADGSYEAVWHDVNQTLVLPRDIGADHPVLRWAIRMAMEARYAKMKEVRAALRDQAKHERQQDIEEGAEAGLEKSRSAMFLEPTVSFVGIKPKGEMWQTKESFVSEQATG